MRRHEKKSRKIMRFQGARPMYLLASKLEYQPLNRSNSQADVFVLLRGTILNGTYGTHKKLPGIYLAIFTNNIWS